MAKRLKLANVMLIGGLLNATACSPRVEVAVPDKPIEINLNVKIDHEVRIRIDKDLDSVISKDSGLF